jgi:hypothetical protein
LITKPSNKIIILIILAFMVLGSTVYAKYGTEWQNTLGQQSTLSYSAPTSTGNSISNSQYQLSPEKAYANPAFTTQDNLTDRFAKTAFASYMALENAGVPDNQAASTVISGLASSTQEIGYPSAYTASTIQTFSPNDKIAVKNYGNTVASIAIANLTMVANNQAKYNNDLNALAGAYDALAAQLSKVAVPSDILSTHLDMINGYALLAQSFRDFNNYENDPLKGVLAAKNIQDIQANDLAVYTKLSAYFKTNGILFTKDDPGYKLWNQ